MNNQQILLAAIEKARNGGWKKYGYDYVGDYYSRSSQTFSTDRQRTHINEILFDKEFWKALVHGNREVGVSYEGYRKDDEGNTDGRLEEAWIITEWQYHIQQISLEDDRIKYLKSFI